MTGVLPAALASFFALSAAGSLEGLGSTTGATLMEKSQSAQQGITESVNNCCTARQNQCLHAAILFQMKQCLRLCVTCCKLG